MLVSEVLQNKPSLLQSNEYGGVYQSLIANGIKELSIEHQNCHARLSLYGGHVLNWQPNAHQEVFWLSKTAEFKTGKAIRGGIPICWPWFGPYKDAGNHGFARTSDWALDKLLITKSSVEITISLEGQQLTKQWPYSFKVTQVLTFGDTFKQQFIVENRSEESFSFSNALHSYFNVSHPQNVTVPGLNTAHYDDKISQLGNCKAQEFFDCVGPIDKIYHHNSSVTLLDKGLNRAIEINKSNCAQWVLWNPGAEIASKMADIHLGGENEYVCLEAANTNWVAVAARQTISLSQEIRTYKL